MLFGNLTVHVTHSETWWWLHHDMDSLAGTFLQLYEWAGHSQNDSHEKTEFLAPNNLYTFRPKTYCDRFLFWTPKISGFKISARVNPLRNACVNLTVGWQGGPTHSGLWTLWTSKGDKRLTFYWIPPSRLQGGKLQHGSLLRSACVFVLALSVNLHLRLFPLSR